MTRVKICGVTRPEDALEAARAGAHAIGMIFCESPRRIEPGRAREIVRALPPFVAAVGVFAGSPPEQVIAVAREVGLCAVQLHGEESPEVVREVAQAVKVIKSVRVRDEASLAGLEAFDGASALLFDAHVQGALGGTGRTFDWALLERALGRLRKPWILAGGLTPENVEAAVRRLRPWAVDTSSGVEARPGVKDPARVREFIAKVRRSDDGDSGQVR